jgi:hypothetical protein
VRHLFFKGIRGTHEPRDLQWRQMRDLRRLDPDGSFAKPSRRRSESASKRQSFGTIQLMATSLLFEKACRAAW